MDFVGRGQELRLLNGLFGQPGAQFLLLYGRRRIGKTRLIEQWLTQHVADTPTLFWTATQTSTVNQLRHFSQALLQQANPEAAVSPTFSYESWATAFAEVARLAAEKRLIVVLDEFTYVMQANPEVASILQRAWDHQLKATRLFLVLSGSLAGIIQRTALDYQAPLYGRATAGLKLLPLLFGALAQALPAMTAEQRVAVYALTGGVPAYLELIDDRRNVLGNLRERIITPANLMLTDAVFLLGDQLDEPRNYMALLEAIANGAHALRDVARLAGLDRSNANKYLSVLQELGYVERLVPATARHPERSRRGRFVIDDPYLRFYFRFLRPYTSEIERGRFNPVLNLLRTHLTDFIGTHTFEELSREWLAVKADLDELPFPPDRIGSHWSKTAQVDVVAINWRSKQILLGECKWGRRAVPRRVVDELVDKTARVLPSSESWQVHYGFFSRRPLTDAAQRRAATLPALTADIATMEQDMVRWLGER